MWHVFGQARANWFHSLRNMSTPANDKDSIGNNDDVELFAEFSIVG
jgi:hypothetical protein